MLPCQVGSVKEQMVGGGLFGAWSTHTKPSHTRVNSPHFLSTDPIYEIKKDNSEGAYGI